MWMNNRHVISQPMALTISCTNSIMSEWVSEQCFTSPPTQYRLFGIWFLQVKRPNQQYQSTGVCVSGRCSSWISVTSGVPQGSVLGPLLFLIFINDLESGLLSSLLKFADDTKVFCQVNGERDREQLQADLNRLTEWSEKWQMPFNTAVSCNPYQ